VSKSHRNIRILNHAFNDLTGNFLNFYPADKTKDIDTLNERIYHTVNNGVYKCGFATTQKALWRSINPLFETTRFF